MHANPRYAALFTSDMPMDTLDWCLSVELNHSLPKLSINTYINMKPMFSLNILENTPIKYKLPLECEFCHKMFLKQVKEIKLALATRPNTCKFCSKDCRAKSTKNALNFYCNTCGIAIQKRPSDVKKSKLLYCSSSCFAKYNNKNRSTGTKRSKLELFIESELSKMYPFLYIKYNKTQTINAELDIYIPELSLAFELNGIVHYEPIYGPEKLSKIQNNDNRKFQACLEQQIELAILDVSSLKHFTPLKGKKYLDIIMSIIDKKRTQSSSL